MNSSVPLLPSVRRPAGVALEGFAFAGEEAGSKLDKAQELKIPVLDEAGLLAMLASEPG